MNAIAAPHGASHADHAIASSGLALVGQTAVRGVTVLCDVLRPDGSGQPGGVDRGGAWLRDAVRRQIQRASGLPTCLLAPATSPALMAWISALRTPAQADEVWAAAFADLPTVPPWTEAIERLIITPLEGQFCVGYELPPYLVRLLDRHAIPYIDIRLHPVRFMDDLMFAVRATDDATQSALSALAVPEVDVIATAGLREAMCRYIGRAAIPPDTLLVIGQRPFDSSQIVGGHFFDAMDHRDTIASVCARHRGVLLKPHPHDREHSLLTVAAGIGGNVIGVVADNIYRLLAMPEISALLTVSSSVADEAPYFDTTVHRLAPPSIAIGWRDDESSADTHFALGDVALSVDFWRIVLAPHAETTPLDGVRLTPKPNRLRIALDSFWNFQEIDSDRIPARPAAAQG